MRKYKIIYKYFFPVNNLFFKVKIVFKIVYNIYLLKKKRKN